ncbi:MAG: response regulator [Gemmatimonadales bacterium]|nr:response regulator [Gemmatimonadales bacterium]
MNEATYTYWVLGFLGVCLAAWFWLERDRARRGERLIAATRRMAAGDLEARAGVRGHDDLGVLADAIAQMAERLKTLGATYHERQEWFGLLLEHSSDLIFTLDAEWRIGFAGPSLPRFLGWPMDRMVRRPLAEFLHPEDAEAVLAALGAASGRPDPGEPIAFRLLHVDGSWRSVEAIACPPRNWSGAERIVVTARDIGARERLERELAQAQQMAVLGRFAGGVAHDFDNLLTAIQGYTSLLLRDLRPDDSQREGLEEIRQSSERAAGLTRQILAFGRRHAAESGPVDLNGLIGNLVRLLPPLIGDDLALVTVLAPSIGMVRADAGQLEQVIMNLVVNARDAMPDGGRLTIATANEHISDFDSRASPELPPGRYVMLTVRDTGTGIDPAALPSIFEPFFTTKELGRGLGLGLATVYGIVKQCEGHIDVESAPGRGTSVRVYLPMARAESGAYGPGAPNPARSERIILLVEDEEPVRLFAKAALEEQGYRVLEAGHGWDALMRLSEFDGTINLVIADVMMPEMGGSELARRLAIERPGLPILFLSGYTDDEMTLRGLGPPSAFVQKPFTPDVLARRVRELLG